MHTGRLSAEVVQETKACSVGEQDAEDTHAGDKASAVNGAKGAQDEDSVDDHNDNGHKDQRKVVVDIFDESLAKTLEREEMGIHMHLTLLIFEKELLDLLFEAKVSIFIDVGVAVDINHIPKLDGLGSDEIVSAKAGLRVQRVREHGLIDIGRRRLTDHAWHIDEVSWARVDRSVTSTLLDLFNQFRICVKGVSRVEEISVLINAVNEI